MKKVVSVLAILVFVLGVSFAQTTPAPKQAKGEKKEVAKKGTHKKHLKKDAAATTTAPAK